MAEGRDPAMGEELEVACELCRQQYPQSKVHSSCHHCVNRLNNNTGSVSIMSEVQSGKVIKCQLCSKDEAGAFCRQCVKFLCTYCVEAHQRMEALFSGHEVSTLGLPASNHSESVSAPKIRKELIEQLDPLQTLNTGMLQAKHSVAATISEVKGQGNIVSNGIEDSFAELQQVINARKKELLEEAAAEVEQKSNRLSQQEEDLSKSCDSVESMIDYTKQWVKHLSDNDLEYVYAEMKSQIDNCLKEHKKESKALEPEEEVDLGVEVSCADDLKKLLKSKAKITKLRVTLAFEGLKPSTEVNKTSQFEIETLIHGKPTKRSYEVKCSLKSPENDSPIDCQVKQITVSKWQVQYTPTVLGRHMLLATVNDLKVSVVVFATRLTGPVQGLNDFLKPIHVIPGLKDPRDVAVTSTGSILVTESNNVAVFNSVKEMKKNLPLFEHGIVNPCGIAVDKLTGCIFITGWGKTILKLNKDLKVEAKFSGSHYQRLTVAGSKVMVCEDERKVKVLHSRDLTCAGQPKWEKEKIEGMCVAENGNLYVCNSVQKCIHVFSSDGELLKSFGQQEAKYVRKLHCPVGICVAGQYVYVTDNLGHCVSVFTTDGEYVTSFGRHGNSKNGGDFCNPCGICVSRGFVYVCDHNNGRVQVFKLVV